MATPTTPITLNDVNVELGHAGTTAINMNQADVRDLAEKPSGIITMNDLRNKSALGNLYEEIANLTSFRWFNIDNPDVSGYKWYDEDGSGEYLQHSISVPASGSVMGYGGRFTQYTLQTVAGTEQTPTGVRGGCALFRVKTKPGTGNDVFSNGNGAFHGQIDCSITSGGTFSFKWGNGVTGVLYTGIPCSANTDYFVSWDNPVHGQAGTCNVYFNGVKYSAAITARAVTTTAVQIQLGGNGGNNINAAVYAEFTNAMTADDHSTLYASALAGP